MVKKIIALALAVLLVASLAACGASNTATSNDAAKKDASSIKIGAVLVGDENEGYTYAHIEGIKTAAKKLGIADDQILWKYSIPEDETCQDACVDLAETGCNLVITNSYGHQSYCQAAAEKYPDVQFVSMTGDTAKASGLKNFKNAFTNVYESRYVSGVVAGMKLQELDKAGKIADSNKNENGTVKIGYVGAFPYAEVVSGYTAFFLGVKSVFENVEMEVQYTNSWFDLTKENATAKALMADGCIIIGQHADSTGAPSAVQEAHDDGKVAFSVGYNVDMLEVAKDVALTSAANIWAAYYTYAFETVLGGEQIDTNWAKGYADDAVKITDLGSACAEGTQAKVDEVIAGIKDGSIHVFDCSKFTCNNFAKGDGKAYIKVDKDGHLTSALATDTNADFVPDADEAIIDGYYHESYFQSAPSFAIRIDGIKELTTEG